MPSGVLGPAGGGHVPDQFPRGWWWASELVRLHYVNTPGANCYKQPNLTTGDKVFNGDNPFRCPEGITELEQSWGAGFPDGDYPTDSKNNGFAIYNDTDAAIDGFGVPSWYQLNSRVITGANQWPNGSGITPFVWFNTGAQPADIADPRYRRTMSLIRKASEFVMIVETNNPNWHDGTESSTYKGNFCTRIAGRHGKKRTTGGANADLNIAFFDGHVALFPSERFQPKSQLGKFTDTTIVYVNKAR
jgi:prepilin-type processing-associated H-X9-DG protein